jgi:iron-sulfur cluster repair protein YtfE (RIC family)
VSVAEAKFTKDMVVNDAIKLHPATIEVFYKFHIDSCCGGAESIEGAAKRDGADLEALLAALNEAAAA